MRSCYCNACIESASFAATHSQAFTKIRSAPKKHPIHKSEEKIFKTRTKTFHRHSQWMGNACEWGKKRWESRKTEKMLVFNSWRNNGLKRIDRCCLVLWFYVWFVVVAVQPYCFHYYLRCCSCCCMFGVARLSVCICIHIISTRYRSPIWYTDWNKLQARKTTVWLCYTLLKKSTICVLYTYNVHVYIYIQCVDFLSTVTFHEHWAYYSHLKRWLVAIPVELRVFRKQNNPFKWNEEHHIPYTYMAHSMQL